MLLSSVRWCAQISLHVASLLSEVVCLCTHVCDRSTLLKVGVSSGRLPGGGGGGDTDTRPFPFTSPLPALSLILGSGQPPPPTSGFCIFWDSVWSPTEREML